jgi:hypothetical protein
MLKARTQHGDVIIGLSRAEIRQLVDYQPIMVQGRDLGIKHNTLLLFGETEIGIAADLMAQGIKLKPRKLNGSEEEYGR